MGRSTSTIIKEAKTARQSRLTSSPSAMSPEEDEHERHQEPLEPFRKGVKLLVVGVRAFVLPQLPTCLRST